MKADYEDRVDDHIITGAEISKERREISRRIRELTEADKLQHTTKNNHHSMYSLSVVML